MIYKTFLKHYLKNDLSLTEDSFKVALFTKDYTPRSQDEYYHDLTSEVTGTGYTKGGESFTFSGPVSAADNDNIHYKGKNVFWEDASFTARYAVIYRLDKELDYLVAYFNFGEDQTVSEGKFQLGWKNRYVITLTTDDLDSAKAIDIDSKLNVDSENPVQNKVLTRALQLMGVSLDGESIPEEYQESLGALIGTVDKLQEVTDEDIFGIISGGSSPSPTPTPYPGTVDDCLSEISENPVQNKVLTKALKALGIIFNGEDIIKGDPSLQALLSEEDGIKVDEYTPLSEEDVQTTVQNTVRTTMAEDEVQDSEIIGLFN